VFRDRVAELHTLPRVLDGVLERAEHDLHHLRRDADPRPIKGGKRQPVAVAFLTDAIRDGHYAALKQQLTVLRAANAHRALDLASTEAVCFRLDDERADAALCAPRRIGDREDDVDAGETDVGTELLAAREHLVIAMTFGACADSGHVGVSSRLRKAVGDEPLAVGTRSRVALLLLLGAARQDPQRADLLHRQDQQRGHANPRDGLHGVGECKLARADPAVLRREGQHKDALLRQQLFDVLRVLVGPVNLGGARCDACSRELLDGHDHQPFVRREGRSLSNVRVYCRALSALPRRASRKLRYRRRSAAPIPYPL